MDEAVMEALWNYRWQEAAALIRAGGNIRTYPDNPFGWKLMGLIWASEAGQLEIVQALIQRGADVNDHRMGRSALSTAIYHGHREIADFLREHGAK